MSEKEFERDIRKALVRQLYILRFERRHELGEARTRAIVMEAKRRLRDELHVGISPHDKQMLQKIARSM